MLCVFPCFCYFFLYLICFYLLLIIFIYLFFLFLFAFSAFGLFLFVLFSVFVFICGYFHCSLILFSLLLFSFHLCVWLFCLFDFSFTTFLEFCFSACFSLFVVVVHFCLSYRSWLLLFCLYSFTQFLKSFLPHHAVCRFSVSQPETKPEFLWWECWIQDAEPPKKSQSQEILIGESSPSDLHLDIKSQLHRIVCRFQCLTPDAKQLATPQ